MWTKTLAGLGCICLLLVGCSLAPTERDGSKAPREFGNLGPTLTPFQPMPLTAMPTIPEDDQANPSDLILNPDPEGGEGALKIWVSPAFIGNLNLPPTIKNTEDQSSALIHLEVSAEDPVSHWLYALVTPFPDTWEEVSLSDLKKLWNGKSVDGLEERKLWVSPATQEAFMQVWGRGDEGIVTVASDGKLLDKAWDDRPALAIVPFEKLNPRWKVLAVDGESPIKKGFEMEEYPLTIPFSYLGSPPHIKAVKLLYGADSEHSLVPPGNYEGGKLTTLVMTGVTALVRATAHTMEVQGIRYPARDIGDLLKNADITHISNEVPFARDCPYPNPVQQGVVFCSDARYLDLLKFVGTDIVELTGDHFHDWGAEAMHYTIDLYDEEGWGYYGGGRNVKEGKKAITTSHNGNKLAFIGCNGKGGGFARATATNPGSVPCDFGYMKREIEGLVEEGYVVIATFQHFEYYTYAFPSPSKADFYALADAGAAIISGSQAHHPHNFEFRGESFIHYGLGNLFFDQYTISPGTRQAFIDRHVIYDGRHISTELLTIMFVDFARSRPMTTQERNSLLNETFSASGW